MESKCINPSFIHSHLRSSYSIRPYNVRTHTIHHQIHQSLKSHQCFYLLILFSHELNMDNQIQNVDLLSDILYNLLLNLLKQSQLPMKDISSLHLFFINFPIILLLIPEYLSRNQILNLCLQFHLQHSVHIHI